MVHPKTPLRECKPKIGRRYWIFISNEKLHAGYIKNSYQINKKKTKNRQENCIARRPIKIEKMLHIICNPGNTMRFHSIPTRMAKIKKFNKVNLEWEYETSGALIPVGVFISENTSAWSTKFEHLHSSRCVKCVWVYSRAGVQPSV